MIMKHVMDRLHIKVYMFPNGTECRVQAAQKSRSHGQPHPDDRIRRGSFVVPPRRRRCFGEHGGFVDTCLVENFACC